MKNMFNKCKKKTMMKERKRKPQVKTEVKQKKWWRTNDKGLYINMTITHND